MEGVKQRGMKIKEIEYSSFCDHEYVLLFYTYHKWEVGVAFKVWKDPKNRWKDFSIHSTEKLLRILFMLIESSGSISPNEKTAIKKLSGWIIKIARQRIEHFESLERRMRWMKKQILEMAEQIKKIKEPTIQ